MTYQLQVAAERDRVWVHAPDGSTVGRFSVRAGIDIHHTISEQIAGKSQCLKCTHTPPTLMEWQDFRLHALTNWEILIPEDSVEFGPAVYTEAIRAAMSAEQIDLTVEDFGK